MRCPTIFSFALAFAIFLCVGCGSSATPSDAADRWRRSGDYYALLELVDRHIDPQWNDAVSKADVVKYLGNGIQNPDIYPNAGPNLWVYASSRPVAASHYLIVGFNNRGMVKDVSWASE
jgi:hypothetical protein